MKTLKLEDNTARKLYQTGTSELKTVLEESFGKNFFSQKITDRINSEWQNILETLGQSDEGSKLVEQIKTLFGATKK